MRHFSFIFAALVVAWGAQAAAQSRSSTLPLAAGQATSLFLDSAIRDVVIGDPEIADVSLINERTLVVLGKRSGVTSLLIYGPGGRPLTDRQVVVSEGAGSVTVYRGAATSTYACGLQCTRLPSATSASRP